MIKIDRNLSKKIAILHAVISTKRYSTRIQRLFALLIVFILMAISISGYDNFSNMARKVSFYYYFVAVRNNDVIDYAVTGIWPSENITPENNNYQYKEIHLDHISSNQGSFVIHYKAGINNNDYAEAYRLVNIDQTEPTLYWVCGYSQARKDEIITESNVTNVAKEQLNPHCRSKRNSM